ncbi:MAG: pyruvate kinase [Candidatus Nanoarchaeia archaeon]|nr:pyruvate kinase [Candidatus Nanoarchaeia archaeon]
MIKKTKIVCTIGPACLDKNVLQELIEHGMNAARINMSHGDFNQYDKIISNLRSICNEPVILDTQGPEVRTVNDLLVFKKGDIINFGLSINIFSKLKINDTFYLNDGLDEGEIYEIKNKKVFLKMKTDGELMPNRSISFRNINLDLPLLTKKDFEGFEYAIKNNIEFIALSFTKNKKDVLFAKKNLKDSCVKIIAKIENQQGVDNIDEIIESADAIMVARGDLGIEIPSEKVPIIQKDIIKKCNVAGKPVIVATQMMESMIINKTPTRAETSDVANAIIDGADAIMLSAETSIGKYPALVVKTMTKICINTETNYNKMMGIDNKSNEIPDVIAYNAYLVSNKLNAKIICLTRSGYTARMINRFKPNNLIIAFTPNEITASQLMISYGIMPVHYKELKEYNLKEVHNITKLCLKKKFVDKDDVIVFSAGLFVKKTTNTIIAYKVKELLEI